MCSAASQAYLHTRVSAMATRLLAPDLVARMARMPLAELAERFRLPAIAEDEHSVRSRSRATEQSLIQLLLAELQILGRPMHAAERAIVLAWGRKYALFNLKALIRGKLHALDQQEIRDNLFELPAGMGLHDQDLLRAENVLELLRQLEAGPYSLIARQAREIYEQRREPFALEAAIDQSYYVGLSHRILALRDDNLAPLRRLIGAELDRIDLLWLLRFRFSYRLSPSETFYQLVPSMRLLQRERLLQLVNMESIEQTIAALPAPLNARLADCTTVIQVQRQMGRLMAQEAHHTLRQSRSAVARALAYLMLRERDLLLLFALIQGRLLGLPDATIDMALDIGEHSAPTAGAPPGNGRESAPGAA